MPTTTTPPSPARHAELVGDKARSRNRDHRHRPRNLDPFLCPQCGMEASDVVALESLRAVEALAVEFEMRVAEVLPMQDPAYIARRVEMLLDPKKALLGNGL